MRYIRFSLLQQYVSQMFKDEPKTETATPSGATSNDGASGASSGAAGGTGSGAGTEGTESSAARCAQVHLPVPVL